MMDFMQTLARDGVYDGESRDERLDQALTLLDSRVHRPRNGLASLAAIIALTCSGVLLATILSAGPEGYKISPAGNEGATHVARDQPAATTSSGQAAFELSGSSMSAGGTESSTAQPSVRDAVLIGTEPN